jgi:hypothetical protein
MMHGLANPKFTFPHISKLPYSIGFGDFLTFLSITLCFVHKYILPAGMYIPGTYSAQHILILISQINLYPTNVENWASS